jgi:futalosine hydrolase
MPNILIVAATAAEIQPFLDAYAIRAGAEGRLFVSASDPDVFTLITGTGMVKTAFELGKLIGSRFDLAINAGICGCFTGFGIGDLVNVTQDRFSEMGAEDDRKFITIDELGLGEQAVTAAYPFEHPLVATLPVTNGITVNRVHGNEKSIARMAERFQPHVETMEGASFLYAANGQRWKSLQLRAVSNMVTRRDRDSWSIDLAVKNLNDFLIRLVESLNKK